MKILYHYVASLSTLKGLNLIKRIPRSSAAGSFIMVRCFCLGTGF